MPATATQPFASITRHFVVTFQKQLSKVEALVYAYLRTWCVSAAGLASAWRQLPVRLMQTALGYETDRSIRKAIAGLVRHGLIEREPVYAQLADGRRPQVANRYRVLAEDCDADADGNDCDDEVVAGDDNDAPDCVEVLDQDADGDGDGSGQNNDCDDEPSLYDVDQDEIATADADGDGDGDDDDCDDEVVYDCDGSIEPPTVDRDHDDDDRNDRERDALEGAILAAADVWRQRFNEATAGYRDTWPEIETAADALRSAYVFPCWETDGPTGPTRLKLDCAGFVCKALERGIWTGLRSRRITKAIRDLLFRGLTPTRIP